MSAGRLRHRITIQQNSHTRSATGAVVDEWVNIAKDLPAEIKASDAKDAGESYSEDQINATITHEIRIRYRTGIDAEQRVLHRSVEYLIVGPPVNLHFRDRWLILKVKRCD